MADISAARKAIIEDVRANDRSEPSAGNPFSDCEVYLKATLDAGFDFAEPYPRAFKVITGAGKYVGPKLGADPSTVKSIPVEDGYYVMADIRGWGNPSGGDNPAEVIVWW